MNNRNKEYNKIKYERTLNTMGQLELEFTNTRDLSDAHVTAQPRDTNSFDLLLGK